MVVEGIPKSIITDDQITANPNRAIEDDNNLEKGEILDEDDSSATSKPVVHQSHPLENSWTFWFDTPTAKSKQASRGSSMRPIYTFSTVEEFWSIYNNVHHPGKLVVGADFYCFKHKIEPKWEDPICANDGKWTANYQRGKSDTSWLYTLLARIGEQFDHGEENARKAGGAASVRHERRRDFLF
ncbi:unnamed protein product [Vicia faba]|uniref:Eukaryotic translation initiation factor 4E-1 n=1 Tax=Vicia faba TaxID=3906 RepID=A0AAV1A8I2_VICFA|nr:unnamed protein product [Vicia faba]